MRQLILAAAVAMAASPAWAQALDGTWTEATPRGSALSVTVSNNQVTSYYFQGRPQGLSGGRVSGAKATFGVAGPNQGQATITKGKGNSLTFRYTDKTGPEPMVTTLTRQRCLR